MGGVQRIRIIGGRARGRTVHTAPGDRVRPTPAALREALANMLRSSLAGAAVLDVCAGFGTVGLELLSQGADLAVFLEKDGRNADVIRRNVAELELDDAAEVWTSSAETGLDRLAREGRDFDVIFIDPPYGVGLAPKLLERVARTASLLRPEGLVVVQHTRHEPLPAAAGSLVRRRERAMGDTLVSFYRQGEL